MKNKWTTFLYGYVRIRIEGPYAERLLNRCIEERLTIWNIKRISETSVICYLALEDVSRLRPLLKMTSCKVRFTERKGLPFLFRAMLSRGGFATGITAFIAILFLLSNMVWNISIEGATPEVEHELEQIVKEMGIEKGKFHFLLPSVEEIQKEVTERLEDATWVGVNLSGTTYHFQVVEQELPDPQEQISPRHLVASKKAVIHDIFVEEGQALVTPNDFVDKGDMLVSGFIGKEGKTELVPATANVLGEIWYKSEVDIPLKSSFETLTGDYKNRHYVTLFNVDLPIWGFGKPEFINYEIFVDESNFRFLNWELPIGYKEVRTLEKKELTREYTEEEAKEVGMEMAKVQLEKRLADDSVIRGENVLHETIENGKVKLEIHYQVIEDITSEQPIIQGD
ncbi:sporulation protein YqfD [Desertibacillus haloalkaliphilus]|uniref:sporulation protein YqfD n=1 Tax=Desertibacillus haloalkaliphilus TaxID=1328930 RepID=UPI001C273DB7|nr:sporulation protein YqfD [Desertibacillus haloalkaliphilus]MBU8905664.1 sporulation protein YqfD [Desertibacillus haloalkaliphilus]